MYISVKVTTDAKKENVQVEKKRLLIKVREPAKQNLANKRVIELVAHHFHVAPKEVRLISGHHEPSKIVSIPD